MRFKKALKWAGVGFVGFIVLAITIAIFGSENPGDEEAPPSFSELADTPAPTNTIMPLSSDTPADVPAPTMTPERATINPTETPAVDPTYTPAPTPSPTPTPTMKPSIPTATPAALGIDGAAVREAFEDAGFFWDAYPLQEGRPTLVGHGPNEAAVQVFGPPSNPTKARLFVVFSEGFQGLHAETFFIIGFLELFAPTWLDAADWVADNMIRSANVGELSTSYGHLTLTMEVTQGVSAFTLEARSPAPTLTPTPIPASTLTATPTPLVEANTGLISTARKLDMNNYVVSDSGVKVWKSPDVHPLLQHTDTTHSSFLDKLAETYSRGKVRGLPRILSENSEDARTWHYFSPLLRDGGGKTQVLERLLTKSFPETISHQLLDSIPSAELIFWPKLSPPPSRPQKEGASEPDILIRLGNQGLVLVEAKYRSGVSERTTYDEARDQVIRLIDVGSYKATQENLRDQDAGSPNSYVIVLQYGDADINAQEVVDRYKGNPGAIEKALSYRSDLTTADYQRLGRSVAFVRWPDPMNR